MENCVFRCGWVFLCVHAHTVKALFSLSWHCQMSRKAAVASNTSKVTSADNARIVTVTRD